MSSWLAVFLGGGLGALARAAVQNSSLSLFGSTLYGTVSVNIAGSFLLGLLWGISEGTLQLDERLRSGLSAGFLGALTTFSTFTYDAVNLLRQGELVTCMAYVIGSVAVGLVLCWLGFRSGLLVG